jgi:nucleotide-binding universal stress UspA family protein
MKKILVPCDFSTNSLQAFRFALDVAKQANGSVHLLYVIELPVLHDSLLMPTLYFEKEFMKETTENAQKSFEKMITKFNTSNVNVTSHVKFGPINKVILAHTIKHSINLIMMGSHGASGIKELVGSNAERLVRTSSVPVLVIKNKIKGPIKRIIFPNALETETQVDLIMRVKALQAFFKAHLHVVWINTPLGFTPDTITRPKLKALARQFELKNCTLDIFNYTDFEGGINAYTDMMRGDMIALGTHGRTGLAHIFNSSITENIVNHNSTPVWTFVSKE